MMKSGLLKEAHFIAAPLLPITTYATTTTTVSNRQAEGIRGDGHQQNRGRGNDNIRRRRRIIFRNEEEEIREAIERSLVEQ